jgi:hypothetical protein
MNVIRVDKHLKIMTEYCQLPHIAELQVCNVWLDKCLWLFEVLENLTVKTGLSEDGADERRNVSGVLVQQCYLVYEKWCMKR